MPAMGQVAQLYTISSKDHIDMLLVLPDGVIYSKRIRLTMIEVENIIHELLNAVSAEHKQDTTWQAPAFRLYNYLIRWLRNRSRNTILRNSRFGSRWSFAQCPILGPVRRKVLPRQALGRYHHSWHAAYRYHCADKKANERFARWMAELPSNTQKLPGVDVEIKTLSAIMIHRTVLENADFTRERIEKALDATRFDILHFASHGQFESDRTESFISTWKGSLDIDRLAELVLRHQVKKHAHRLITLSACQTAFGDDRSALGLEDWRC